MDVWFLLFGAAGGKPAGRRRAFSVSAPGLGVWLTLVAALTASLGMPLPAVAAPAAVDHARHFTLRAIEPDAGREEVRLVFSQFVPREILQSRLQLLPPVKIDWQRSAVDDAGVLTLRGAFKYGARYRVTLPENLVVGGRTYRRTVDSFFLPDLPPRIEFLDPKSVIERDSRQMLQVRVRNLTAIRYESLRLPPLCLPQALSAAVATENWQEFAGRLQTALKQAESVVPKSLASLVAPLRQDRQLFSTAGEPNKPRPFSLPLTFRPDKSQGALELIRLQAAQPEGVSAVDIRLFQITDLGLTYKVSADGLLVWVTSLQAGAPVGGVRLFAFTREAEVFPLGAADKDGILIFTGGELAGLSVKEPGRFTPVTRRLAHPDIAFVLARTKDDVAFIEVRPAGGLKPEGLRQVSGDSAWRTLNGSLFTERGVYRPGDTIHFKGAVREYQRGRITTPGELACTFELTSPKGDKVFSSEADLSDFGTAAGDIPVEPHWPLGVYTLTLRYDPGIPVASGENADTPAAADQDESPAAPKKEPFTATTTFQIQEFKPPRHFVEIAFAATSRPQQDLVNRPGVQEFVRITISGAYYAGGPVKHGQVRWKIFKAPTSFRVKGFDDFTFGCEEKDQGELIESGQAVLDEAGKTDFEFPLDRAVLAGLHGLSVVATVVDFDGRAVAATKVFLADPEVLVGLSSHPRTVQAGQPQVLKAVVVRRGQKLTRGSLQAEVLQRGGTYVAKRNEVGDVFWDYQDIWRRVLASDLSLEKGEASLNFDFAYGGDYRIAFTYTDDHGRSFTSATLYEVSGDLYWQDYDNRDKSHQTLPLAADQDAYAPGQQARLRVSPRRTVTYYLVTAEQGGVLDHRVVAAGPHFKEIPLAIKAAYAPNVYVSVLGLTPRGEFPVFAGRYDTEAPGFFWNTLNLPVRLDADPLTVKISPGAKDLQAEPGASVDLDFTVLAPDGKGVEAELAVAVVDERVLALTAFKTPTLDQLLKFDRPLTVFTGELRTLLMHQTPFSFAKNEPLTGGGGLEPGAEGLMGKLRKRFDPVAYFTPALRTDAAGKGRVSFTLPDTLTTYRVYTVALDRGARFASAERPLLAVKDFYLEPGMPAFFTRGDTFQFQVTAFNGTTAAGPVEFSAAAEGGLKLKAQPPTATLPAKDSLALAVSGEAAAPGPARALFTGKFQGRTDAVAEDLKINSGHLRDTNVLLGSVSTPGDLRLSLPDSWSKIPWNDVGPQEVQAVLTLTGSPFLRLSRALNYLLTYPYGCVEQTASGVMALAALSQAINDGLVPGVDAAKVKKYLRAGVGRLLSLQLPSGGFAYWPGHTQVHPWGSVYAAVALALSAKQGLDLGADALKTAQSYLVSQIRSPNPPATLKAFGAFTLSLHQALDRNVFHLLWRDYPKLHREAKLLVLLAAHRAGLAPPAELRAALKSLLGAKGSPGETEGDEDFYGPYRTPALALLAAKELLPGDPLTEQAALFLLGGLDSQGIWTSTSDTGWALWALGDYFQGARFSAEPLEIGFNQPGAPAHRLTLDPRGFRTVSLDPRLLARTKNLQVDLPAGRTVLYQLTLTAPRRDLDAQGAAQGVKVSKSIRNLDGSDRIRVGDLVKVTVSMDFMGKMERYVVLDDPLPAGLVAVNSAFTTEEPTPDQDQAGDFDYFTAEGRIRFRPNFFELREDRVLAFRNQVWWGQHQYEYFARAVCAGRFVLPATKVAGMYTPGLVGYTPRGSVQIEAR